MRFRSRSGKVRVNTVETVGERSVSREHEARTDHYLAVSIPFALVLVAVIIDHLVISACHALWITGEPQLRLSQMIYWFAASLNGDRSKPSNDGSRGKKSDAGKNIFRAACKRTGGKAVGWNPLRMAIYLYNKPSDGELMLPACTIATDTLPIESLLRAESSEPCSGTAMSGRGPLLLDRDKSSMDIATQMQLLRQVSWPL